MSDADIKAWLKDNVAFIKDVGGSDENYPWTESKPMRGEELEENIRKGDTLDIYATFTYEDWEKLLLLLS